MVTRVKGGNFVKNKFLIILVAFLTTLIFHNTGIRALAETMTKEQGDAILTELKQIRLLLQRQQALLQGNRAQLSPREQKVKLDLGDNKYVLGSEDAPVTLVEFTDYQCPYCSRFHRITYPDLKKNYIDTGKLRYVSRDLPLSFHKNALQAARATRCAGEQGKYWELRDVLSLNPKNLSKEGITQYAQEQRLNMNRFKSCFNSTKYGKEIQQDIADAHSVGITGTPGFILGPTSKNKIDGIIIKGAKPYTAFAAQIDTLLAGTIKTQSRQLKK